MFDQCLYFNTSALARRLEREWALAFQPFDLTPAQAFMLRAVVRQPGLLASALAEVLCIARPTATRAIDGLVAKGLLRREASGADGRECCVWPTEEGLVLAVALDKASAAVTRRLREQLGETVFATRVAELVSLRKGLET